jgi:hypothetical protein
MLGHAAGTREVAISSTAVQWNTGDGIAAELATYLVEKRKPFLVVVD